MSPRKSNPNGKDHDAERQMRGKKPRSHAVRHPKEAASVQATQTEPTVIEQAAAVLEQERAAETPPVLHPVVNEDERERLREALRRCEAANAELARATDRRKRAQAEVDAANTRLQTVVAEISSGTGQPSLPFSADQAEAERNAMLQADREANTPALIERLKRARFVLTREQLDALDYTRCSTGRN
jgi:hypothetical protein